MDKNNPSFEGLVEHLEYIHKITSTNAKSAVNQLLTLRNWVIGYYIVEYELYKKLNKISPFISFRRNNFRSSFLGKI